MPGRGRNHDNPIYTAGLMFEPSTFGFLNMDPVKKDLLLSMICYDPGRVETIGATPLRDPALEPLRAALAAIPPERKKEMSNGAIHLVLEREEWPQPYRSQGVEGGKQLLDMAITMLGGKVTRPGPEAPHR